MLSLSLHNDHDTIFNKLQESLEIEKSMAVRTSSRKKIYFFYFLSRFRGTDVSHGDAVIKISENVTFM